MEITGSAKNDNMVLLRQCRKAIKKIVFGDTLLPQECFLGLADPQSEITVWLYGMDPPLDVTFRHSMACAAPFTVCIAFDEDRKPSEKDLGNLSLQFSEREGQKGVLGKISLKLGSVIALDGMELILFEARSSTNYCLPKIRLWVHYLLHSYSQWRKVDTSGMKMSFLERRAAMVMFISPHPVSLVSVVDNSRGNIFPMNIMGNLGNGYFAFALKDSRRAAHLVERTGRIAVSSLPLARAPLAYQLAVNHTKEFIDWEQLPFTTRRSTTFKIPVPAFAQRVREMEIMEAHTLGSHILFLARIICDENHAEGPELCVIHGFYQAWRIKESNTELQASLAEDLFNKTGY